MLIASWALGITELLLQNREGFGDEQQLRGGTLLAAGRRPASPTTRNEVCCSRWGPRPPSAAPGHPGSSPICRRPGGHQIDMAHQQQPEAPASVPRPDAAAAPTSPMASTLSGNLQSTNRCGVRRRSMFTMNHREQHLGEGNPGLSEDPEIHFFGEVDGAITNQAKAEIVIGGRITPISASQMISSL